MIKKLLLTYLLSTLCISMANAQGVAPFLDPTGEIVSKTKDMAQDVEEIYNTLKQDNLVSQCLLEMIETSISSSVEISKIAAEYGAKEAALLILTGVSFFGDLEVLGQKVTTDDVIAELHKHNAFIVDFLIDPYSKGYTVGTLMDLAKNYNPYTYTYRSLKGGYYLSSRYLGKLISKHIDKGPYFSPGSDLEQWADQRVEQNALTISAPIRKLMTDMHNGTAKKAILKDLLEVESVATRFLANSVEFVSANVTGQLSKEELINACQGAGNLAIGPAGIYAAAKLGKQLSKIAK